MRNWILSLKEKLEWVIPLRIIRNTSWLGVANVSIQLTGLLITLIVARVLGPRALGIFVLGITYGGLAPNLAQLGLNVLVRRDVARDHMLTGAYVGKLLPLMASSLGLTFLVLVCIVQLVGYPYATSLVIYLIFLERALDTLASLCMAVFLAHEQMQYVATLEGLISVTKVIAAAVLLLFTGATLPIAVLCFVLLSGAKLAVELVIVFRGFGRFRLELDLPFCRQALGQSLPMTAAAICSFLLLRLDAIILSAIQGEDALGLYSAAYNLFAGADIVTRSFIGAMFPVLAVSYVRSIPTARKLYRRSVLSIGGLGAVLGVGLLVVAGPVIVLLYGPSYSPSAAVLRILAIGLPFFLMSRVCNASLTAIDRQVASMCISFAAVVFNVLVNLWIIPRLSYIGTSITTGLTYLLASGVMLVYTFGVFRRLSVRGDPVVLNATEKSGDVC